MRKHTAIFILAYGITASAQNVEASSYTSYPDTVTPLTGIEVTAIKGDSPLTATAPVHTLNSIDFSRQGITDISEALRRIPGINLRDYGGAGGMKTVSVRGLGNQHTGVSIDGVPAGNVQGGQIDLSRISLNNISALTLSIADGDNIFECARLLSSSSNLDFSSVQFPSLSSRKPDISGKIKMGSFGLITPSFSAALSNARNFGMAVAGDFSHSVNNYPFSLKNGDIVTRERRTHSLSNISHAEWNGIWEFPNESVITGKLYFYNSRRQLPGPIVYYNSDSNQQLNETDLFAQFGSRINLSPKFTLKANAKFDFSRTHYSDKNDIYPNGELDNKYIQKEEYITGSLLYKPLKSLSMVYSIDFWHNSLRSNSKNTNSPLRNSLLQSFSVKWSHGCMTAVARGLFSFITDKSQDTESSIVTRFSPSLGLTIRPIPDKNWRMRLSFKDVIRMPTFSELYFDHYGSINLKPERAYQFNIGTTYGKRFESWLSEIEIMADSYMNMLRNKIVAVPYNLFVWTMTNLGRVKIIGTDVSLNTTFSPSSSQNLILSINYSYQRAVSVTDRSYADWNKQLPYTPLNSGGASLSWLNPYVNFVIHATGCSARYSTTLNIPSSRIAGFIDSGIGLFRSFLFRSFELETRIDIDNIFDKTYELVARYPMPGRNFSVTVGIKY